MPHAAAALKVEVLETYLSQHLEGFEGPISFEKTPIGQSNPTFLLTTPSGEYVLRRKPPGQLLKSAHAVDREFRVMSALRDSSVPVPAMLHLCEDELVIGSVFFVMERVHGRNFLDPRVPEIDNEARAALYDSMNKVLAALHSVDVDRIGLANFGRPGNYFLRQINRWTKQYRASETDPVPQMDALMIWLEQNTPPDDGWTGLVHGDYRIDNLLIHPHLPKVVAVLDWELSTLGHPFADLGYQCMQWRMPVGEDGRGLEGVDRAAIGIPSEAAYVERYAERMGWSDVPDMTFCMAFSFFRMAAIVQGVMKRGLDGNASNPERAIRMGRFVPVYAEKAMALLDEA
ncbi:MAG: phosphotransferase family protein [Geminicoccaceae bacterium]